MNFFRWTEKQVALLPEQIEIKGERRKTIRQSIWKQVYELVRAWKIDASEFEPGSIQEMCYGRAPWVKDTQTTGNEISDMKYHIHHKQTRWSWGSHDLYNLLIVTPRYHRDGILDPATHYGERNKGDRK